MADTLLEVDAPAAAEPETPGGKALTADLLNRLERHWIKPGAGGGVFLREVTFGMAGGRRADGIFAGFTRSSGRILVGHEVKVSRADWLHELAQPGKAVWADHCHAWYVVALAGCVKVEELPHGWGLMQPGRSRTRLDVVVRAAVDESVVPAWEATLSLLSRLDTVTGDAIFTVRDEARRDLDQLAEERAATQVAGWKSRAEQAEQKADSIREALGLERYDGLDLKHLRELGPLLRGMKTRDQFVTEMTRGWNDPLAQVRSRIGGLEKAFDELTRAVAARQDAAS